MGETKNVIGLPPNRISWWGGSEGLLLIADLRLAFFGLQSIPITEAHYHVNPANKRK